MRKWIHQRPVGDRDNPRKMWVHRYATNQHTFYALQVHRMSHDIRLRIRIELQISCEGEPTTLQVGSTAITVRHLPRLELHVVLPASYPNEIATFEVACAWLSLKQLSKLCSKLDEVCTDNGGPGNTVVLQWVR
jgi:hypothetical protein